MSTICGEISENISYDCNNPLFGGVEAILYLFNRSDIASFTYDQVNNNIIRGITMKPNKLGYRYEGYNKSVKPKSTGKKGDYSYLWKHEVDFLILANDSSIKEQIEKLSKGEVIAFAVNKMKTNDAAIEGFGTNRGLKMKDGALRDPWDPNQGAYSLGLESPDGEEEPHLPASFAVLEGTEYSYEASIAALEALITPAA